MLRGKIIIALMGIYWLIFVQDAGRVPNVDQYLGPKPVQFTTYMYLFFYSWAMVCAPQNIPKIELHEQAFCWREPLLKN